MNTSKQKIPINKDINCQMNYIQISKLQNNIQM